MKDEKRYRILRSYMEEAGWFEYSVYVVWLIGATDGWPRAIFDGKKAAEHWVTTIPLNPEGYIIEEINFGDLCAVVTDVGEF